MRVTVCKELRMAAAHRLPHHDGKCHRMHGHTYVVRVYVNGPVQEVSDMNPQSGMVVDFGVIKTFLEKVESRFDHNFLNESLEEYPTAERIAVAVARLAQSELDPELPENAKTVKIRVYEEYVAPQAFAEVEL
jgi:6-pyruvoyltetrahydropterin/6-carboxytetrahydropterin synthase